MQDVLSPIVDPFGPQRWLRPSELPTLGRDEVHVWCVPLDFSTTGVNRLSQLISGDEMKRARRFHFDSDRNHFIIARAWLRIILGSYSRVKPVGLKFDYSSYGKPLLSQACEGGPELTFNLTHSGELALYG